jgi:uncharacterized protein Usg
MMQTEDKRLVTCQVFYYMPMRKGLIQEFVFQDYDFIPKYPRMTRFLDFWRREIDAIIQEVILSEAESFSGRKFNKIDEIFKIH